MLPLRFGESVTLLAEQRNPVTGVTVLVEAGSLAGCGWAPVPETSISSTHEAGHVNVVERRNLFAPPASGLTPGQRLRFADGSVWETVGSSSVWRSPLTGWAPGDQVEIKRVTPP